MNLLIFMLDKLNGAVISLPLILLFLWTSDRKRFQKKWGWVILFAVYLNAMLVMVGIPYAGYIRWDPTINWILFQDFSSSNILGMILNVVMLIPFGVFLPIYFKKFQSLSATLLAGFGMSLFIEILQLFTFRATDIDDLIMNTMGTVIGYAIGRGISKKGKETKADKDVLKMIVIIAIVIFVIVFLSPLIMKPVYRLLGM